MKSNEQWSSQLCSQFLQLRKEAWKQFRTSTGLEPVTSRYRCDALPTELWSHWRWEQVNCGFICSRERYVSEWSISDDDRIVSHDAPRLGLYYHCVRDVIIYSTLSRRKHDVPSDLSEFGSFCFQEYQFSLFSLRFQGEFCHYSGGFYLCFVGLSWSTYKLCGKHGWTKKSCHPCGCCEFACGRFIRWGKKTCADTNKFFLWYHGKFSRFCDFSWAC